MGRSSKDWHVILFWANAASVIIGYGLVTYAGSVLLTPNKIVKSFLLAIGLILLIREFYLHPSNFKIKTLYWILIYTLLFGAFFALDLTYALSRVITLVAPLSYIILFFSYLQIKYKKEAIGRQLSSLFQLTYGIPILIFIVFERQFGATNLYSVQAFVRNHYGWSSVLFLLLSADILFNYKIPRWRYWMTVAFIPAALYILFASGSRSSWLSFVLTGGIFLFRSQRLPFWSKPLLIGAALIPLVYFLGDPSSALYQRWEKTQRQIELQEEASDRLLWANAAFREFKREPTLWFTGRGLFDYKGLIKQGGFHNSYYDVMFGTGIFVFGFFLYLFLFRPAYYYFRYYSRYFLTFFPLVIIPFFESNLTGGQFLFFPWFSYMMYYGMDPASRQPERNEGTPSKSNRRPAMASS